MTIDHERRGTTLAPVNRRRPPAAAMAPVLAAAAVLLAACGGAAPPSRDEPPLREVAPLQVDRPGAFIAAPLGTEVYRASLAQLRDLRVVDAAGERVPHARLEPDRDRQTLARRGEALPTYPLLPRPPGGASTAGAPATGESPIDIVVQGDRIEVRRRLGAAAAAAGAVAPGLIVDTGERTADARPAVRALEFAWEGTPEVSAGLRLDSGDDLVAWRPAGTGLLVSMGAGVGAAAARLEQRRVALPADAGRFVRVIWFDPNAAPRGLQAYALVDQTERAAAPVVAVAAVGKADPGESRAVVFDFGAEVPLDEVELRIDGGTRVVPGQLQLGTADAKTGGYAWRDAWPVVFHRIVREGLAASESPPLGIGRRVRALRLVVDPRAPLPAPASLTLVGRYRPASLVFASQGTPPWRLRVGGQVAADGALPIATLVPDLAAEHPRFGLARIGAFGVDADAAAQGERAARDARWRPWLLWGVLGLGVLALAAMVWRLARR